MIILAGITESGVVAALIGDGMSDADARRRALFAILHGCWSSKRRVVIYDDASRKFALVIREAA